MEALFALSFVVSISPLNNSQIYYPQTNANPKNITFTLFIFQVLNCICVFHSVWLTKHLDTPSVIFGVFNLSLSVTFGDNLSTTHSM